MHLHPVREIIFICPILSLWQRIPECSHFTGENLGPSNLFADALEAIELEDDVGLVNPAAHALIETQLVVKAFIWSSTGTAGAY